ncbi:uroporphyrinogen-III C-methyltransferase [Roseospira marina]|uniref:Uroporphyrinogen-III C-methyltransferase n=1 Tax=Roseospira marina TaxID=140057 RepID=A0A5M6IGT0_9PROT|nr:siroheme synthase CysG [Roseospira marina]KAA5607362.1 uroporphyrinogen-III C-methyltransferase [Roseospira marina]MBB4312470.1 uroporphyrin-III C-methyltransferase/precorrin-2 dehydrogenase/sirohydrochlorin ferrochelatase [Roseospira marina]MBB5085514.1 uroporphyrin-III C-methyltransferase/precorrin-2 dehydrogenase/sirohydrochlorin ferrochelatase [Roseospira marina]
MLVSLDLTGRPTLVVGGDAAAAAKARLLDESGSHVTVVTDAPDADVRAMATAGRVILAERSVQPCDVVGRAMVIVAVEDTETAERVVGWARAVHVTVNAVDRPALSDVAIPAMVRRGPIEVGIASGGAAPALARMIRSRIESILPDRIGEVAQFAARFRAAVKATVPAGRARRRLWDRVFQGDIAERILAGDESAAAERMIALINRPAEAVPAADARGVVHLVGAGPGDPELLTLKAQRLLQAADVIFYDSLVDARVLDLARRDATRVPVGKRKGAPGIGQAAIHGLMVEAATDGQRVVRLKGGDPFVFGRGGEEAAALEAAGIDVAVVPGITAALGCAASAGIPLTHRDHASAVTLLTGQAHDDEDVDPATLTAGDHTLVVYMGRSRAGALARRLMTAGVPTGLPVAIIENGTRPDQTVWTGTIATLPDLAANTGDGPALIVLGEVVRLTPAWTARTSAPSSPRIALPSHTRT